jgi:hypothetical protein
MFYIKALLITVIVIVTVSLGYDLYKEAERITEKAKFEKQLNHIRL